LVSGNIWGETVSLKFGAGTFPGDEKWSYSNFSYNSGYTHDEGTYSASTGQKTSGYVQYKESLQNITNVTFYITKTTTNANANSYFKAEISEDGNTWTELGRSVTFDKVTKETWTETNISVDNKSGYIRISYTGTTAVRLLDDITITYNSASASTCSAPTFTPASRTFTNSLTVTASTTTEGAKVVYNTDNGTTFTDFPTNGLNITETTTIYAKTIDPNNTLSESSVESATYTKVDALQGLSALRAKIKEDGITSSGSAKEYYVNLTNAVVTKVSGYAASIEETDGAIYLYASNTLTAGQVINGLVTVKGFIYNGWSELNSIDTSAATIVDGDEPSPKAVTIAELTNNFDKYESRYVKISGAKVTSAFSSQNGEISQDGTTIVLRAASSSITMTVDNNVDVQGIAGPFTKNGTTTNQLNVYVQADITVNTKLELTGDGTFENPYTVTDMKAMKSASKTPTDAVWVKGYIIGSASSGTELNTADKDVESNIALADEVSATTDFLPVQLASGNKLRDITNVSANTENKGKFVYVYGKMDDTYFSVGGIKPASKIYGLNSITIGTAEGYGTYYTKCAYEMPKGLTGSVITNAVEAGELTIEEKYKYDETNEIGDVVPTGTSLLVKGTNGATYNVINTNSTASAPTDNLLHGEDAVDADGNTSVSGTGTIKYYILSYDDNDKNLGFYWGKENGAAMNYADRVVAPHAFLAVVGSANAPAMFSLDGNGDTSSINATMSSKTINSNGRVYSVTGVYVGTNLSRLPKGVYIVNGKKIAVK